MAVIGLQWSISWNMQTWCHNDFMSWKHFPHHWLSVRGGQRILLKVGSYGDDRTKAFQGYGQWATWFNRLSIPKIQCDSYIHKTQKYVLQQGVHIVMQLIPFPCAPYDISCNNVIISLAIRNSMNFIFRSEASKMKRCHAITVNYN